jgi:2-hydroxy-3-oxopropionate reductase
MGATDAQVVGFIGLGRMGRPMAAHLVSGGWEVHVYSRSPGPVRELTGLGAVECGTAEEVARRCPIIVTMLPAGADVEAVVSGPNGILDGLQSGGLLIDMSTIEPGRSRRLAALVAESGGAMVDAPVSGGQRGAMDATLSIMVGGSSEAVERALPVLNLLGKTITRCGDAGAGQVVKACNQLVVGSTIEAVAEAFNLASAAGVQVDLVRSALLGGLASSRVLEAHGQRMITRDFEPGGPVRLHLKDARIVIDMADELDVPVGGFRSFADNLRALAGRGLAELDHSSVLLELERASGSERT